MKFKDIVFGVCLGNLLSAVVVGLVIVLLRATGDLH